jgi:hypothetical protein
MWILEWGDATNQTSGQWNHEEHDSSEKAGVLWMSAEELLDAIEVDEPATQT